MKEEYLEKLRKEFNDIKQRQITNKQNKARLTELKENALVKEYIKLEQEVKKYPKEKTETEIINSIYLKFHIKTGEETNGIYYCLGTFKRTLSEGEVRLPRDSKEAEYRVYADIESYHDIVKVPIKKCQEFEKTHPVILSESFIAEGETEYFKLQKEFFLTSITEDQDKACQKILTKTKKMLK